MADFDRESMLEMFIFEMNQLVEQLEQTVVQSETEYNTDQINEIFRIMHTIKGSSAMMMFDEIARVSHVIEDLFYYLREESPQNLDYQSLSDLVLEGADFVKGELVKIQDGDEADGNAGTLTESIRRFLNQLKNDGVEEKPVESVTPSDGSTFVYKAKIMFENGCEMENIRAYTLVHNLLDHAENIRHIPTDVVDEESTEIIRQNGFFVDFESKKPFEEIEKHLLGTVYLQELDLQEVTAAKEEKPAVKEAAEVAVEQVAETPEIPAPPAVAAPVAADTPNIASAGEPGEKKGPAQHVISVNVGKLDALLNLMGELVISEAMVTQNSELDGLQLDSFFKEARQLRKIINNLQETVMSMRMVPLSGTFFKMHRIVRDMCRQLNKDVQLDIIGEETEVDKNIIEHISDPIMHIIRNSIDHGIEMPDTRQQLGKPRKGVVVLQAKHSGSDVLIIVKDDGGGLNRDKIMNKARDQGMLRKPELEYTDKEIYQFIFMAGFSTNTEVTAFSGRGVGMDVVTNNLEIVGGNVLVDSTPGSGSTFTLKIPLTLAIIEGMTIHMAGAKYTIPIASIKRSFKPKLENVFSDPDGNEMITDRGEIYNIVRLYEFFGIDDAITDLEDGILIQIENGDQFICLMVDELIGEQQAVVQSMPKYFNKIRGLSGCTLLGNGDISLIIDVAGLFDK
ncbi:MAG: chemotaxis protein CheA [Turicibacter sp.]|nr:chemotaxis protein CheA [Turicibacter sp.]